jgi:hypothetical protein
LVPIERARHKENTYEIPIIYHSKDMANVKVFEKWVKLQGQGHRVKNLVPLEKFCHKEHTYEIPITYHSKDMANAKVFETSRSRSQGQTRDVCEAFMPPLDLHYRVHKPFGYEWKLQIIGIFLSPRAITPSKMAQSYPKQNLSQIFLR